MSNKKLSKHAFKKLQREWYKRLDESGFNDIERSGKKRQILFNEYSGLLQKPLSVIRHKYNIFTQKYYEIARFSKSSGFLTSPPFYCQDILIVYINCQDFLTLSRFSVSA